jgi:hypothetical protein
MEETGHSKLLVCKCILPTDGLYYICAKRQRTRTRSRPARKTATQPPSNSGRRAGGLKRIVAKSSAATKLSRSRKRGLHRGRPAPTAAQGAEEAHYRRGISRRLRERKLAFQGGGRCIPQALPNVGDTEIGILGQNFLLGPATSEKPEDGCDGNAQTANARNSAHLRGINGDELEVLHVPSSLSQAAVDRTSNRLSRGSLRRRWLRASWRARGARWWPNC